MTKKKAAKKPELHLISGKAAGELDDLLDLFRALTGREPTPEDIEESRAILEGDDSVPDSD